MGRRRAMVMSKRMGRRKGKEKKSLVTKKKLWELFEEKEQRSKEKERKKGKGKGKNQGKGKNRKIRERK
jgi:hypothetical protein